MMLIAISSIGLALLLYSTAIWSEKITKHLKKWMVITFGCGFTCDIVGTSIMGFQAIGQPIGFHGCCGLAALLIMAVHLAWAILSFRWQGKTAHWFHKFSIYAWIIWLIAFISGMPQH